MTCIKNLVWKNYNKVTSKSQVHFCYVFLQGTLFFFNFSSGKASKMPNYAAQKFYTI